MGGGVSEVNQARISPRNEREYDFTLELTGITQMTREIEDSLFEVGCDDCTICTRDGRVFVTFIRVASSLGDAIRSACHDIRSANTGADVLLV